MAPNYLNQYLDLAPFSHALWRAAETYHLAQVRKTIKFRRPILDLGCGFGEFSGVFFRSTIEVGIDIAAKDLLQAAAKKKYRRLYRTQNT